jgi:antirestriction protein ArdC
MRHYSVFHVGQVNDPNGKFKHLLETKTKSDYETANRILETSSAEMRIGGNRAFYCSDGNYVRVPRAEQFESEEERIVTIFHELGHWGDRNILGKKLSTGKASPEYAFGELVAELTACFLCQACAVPSNFENHES